MAYYDNKIGKYCLTEEEMVTLPKDEAKAKLGKGMLKSGSLIAGGVSISAATTLTGIASIPVAVAGAVCIGAYMGLSGLTKCIIEIRDYFRNNKRLEYDENNEKSR